MNGCGRFVGGAFLPRSAFAKASADKPVAAKPGLQEMRSKMSLLRQNRSPSCTGSDKDTSGVMLFGKTPQANQSLSRQFESHQIEKEYLLLSSARPTRAKFRAKSADAVTEFAFVQPHGRFFLIEARPITGKMHQIRRHAAENGFPIVGDTKYGGEPAPRLMLHAHKLTFEHPTRGEKMTMEASVPVAFEELDALAAAKEFRDLIFDEDTNAFRLISGAADGFPDVIVDSYAGNLLVQWQTEAAAKTGPALLEQLKQRCGGPAIYEQLVTKRKRTVATVCVVWRRLCEPPWWTGIHRSSALRRSAATTASDSRERAELSDQLSVRDFRRESFSISARIGAGC